MSESFDAYYQDTVTFGNKLFLTEKGYFKYNNPVILLKCMAELTSEESQVGTLKKVQQLDTVLPLWKVSEGLFSSGVSETYLQKVEPDNTVMLRSIKWYI